MSKKKKGLIIGIGVVLSIVLMIIIYTVIGLQKMQDNSESVSFEIKSGTGRYEIVENLYSAGIIKNKVAASIYVTVNFMLEFDAGIYTLDRSSNADDILNSLETSSNSNIGETLTITFLEGKRVTDYAKVISDNFGYDYNEVLNVFADKSYAETLIAEYSFLTNEILADQIIYPLEGYLFPNTYEFYKTESIEGIIDKLLQETNDKINSVKLNIDNSGYTIHEILTLSSIVEMEAVTADDRKKVAQVVYKRLDIPMSLGMDVTSYYGVQKAMEEELTVTDLEEINGYNTRPTSVLGLPIGPICNSSFESITAALNPSDTNYVYFCADMITGAVYFQETYDEFINICR